MPVSDSSPADVMIDIQNVWKIFGARADEAMKAVKEQNLTKPEVLEKFDCVVGVADASFQVRAGEIFCVMGLSGSGKSTLVRHINRLLEPTSGRISVNGQDITALDRAGLARMRNRTIAMVFQDFGLMPHRSVRENVAMPLEIRGMGGRLLHAYGTCGEYDMMFIYEMPDMASVAANMHLAEATGMSRYHKVIPLFSNEEFVASQVKAGQLRDSYTAVPAE
jgi:ABC-type sugar transport system ATPase subunit